MQVSTAGLGRPESNAMSSHPIRVLLTKLGLDGHDRGIKVVAAALRDAGMEVIYTGLWQTPEQVAAAAADEDVDVIGVSILSGAHLTLIPRLLRLLEEQGMSHILILAGGIIPEEDAAMLLGQGVARIFGPGTSADELVEFVRQRAPERSNP
jgi:methylmalonyl-CoA mutase C-terminal domain/subunit